MVAEAIGLPLYRRVISGRPTNTALTYVESEGDEVEDLYHLLREIKEKHPEVQGGLHLVNAQQIG